MKPVYFPIAASIATAIGCYRFYLNRVLDYPNDKENGTLVCCTWVLILLPIWKAYEVYNNARLVVLKERFDTDLAQARELTLPEATCFVGIRYNKVLLDYDIGQYTRSLPQSPSTYIRCVVKAIQDSGAIPNNRHLAQLIAEYAIEVHTIFWCQNTERGAILYQSIDSGEANRLVPPSTLPRNANDQTYPVYWNSELCDFAPTRHTARGNFREYWLLHLSGPLNPKLLRVD